VVTKYRKPIRRRVGGLIVEIDEKGVSVRRVRRKTGVRVRFSELAAAADQVRAPRGWIPKAGEHVALLPTRHRALVVTVIESAIELFAKIVFRRGTERIVEVSRLVPVDGGKLVVECERWPRLEPETHEESLFGLRKGDA
jgi:hypothetical protein